MRKIATTLAWVLPAAAVPLARSQGAEAARGSSMRTILVYSGSGAGERSVESLVASLQDSIGGAKMVRRVMADDLLHSAWEIECDLLCMPGGADLPYCAALNGPGNARIRRFVEEGGAYLGICAGSYYGSGRCEFEKDTEMEVIGEREA